MKVFMSVDIEGVACVTNRDHTRMEGAEYEMARRWMTQEANAAVEGALEGGATEVVIADSHGHMRNILPDELHEDALLVRGSPRALSMMDGIDESFATAFFIGYHSMAGNTLGILSHTYFGSTVYAVRLNGTEVGESGINAAVAGHFGVPVGLVTGDDTLATEVEQQLPWAERVITKWALSTVSARNLTPKAAQKQIRAGAARAMQRLSEMEPLVPEQPLLLEVDFIRPIHAQLGVDIPGVERLGSRKVGYTGSDMLEVMRTWRLMLNLSIGDTYL